jgi:hypothetical protein
MFWQALAPDLRLSNQARKDANFSFSVSQTTFNLSLNPENNKREKKKGIIFCEIWHFLRKTTKRSEIVPWCV